MAQSGSVRAGRAFVELFADDSMLIRTLRRAETRIVKFGESIKKIGRRLTTLGIAASVPFVASMKTFASFDDQMRAVKAVTGATGKEFQMLTEKAKLLGRTTSFTTSQVAAGMVELGRAGFSPQEIDDGIAGMLNLARATGTDLSLAAEIAGNTLRRFGLDASEMTRVADVLTATANSSAQTLTDLGESLKDAGPLADTYGLSLEQLSKTLGALANFGIKGSIAGTTMKNIMVRLSDPKIQQGFRTLGVEITELDEIGQKRMRNIADIMADVGKAVEGFDPDVRLAKFNELFGLRAIAGGSKLTTASFERLNQAIDDAAGAAKRTATEMDSGIGGSFRMLWSAIEGVAIAVGEALAPSLQKLTDKFTIVCSGIADYLTKNKQIVIQAAKIVAAITGIGIALFTVGGAIIGFGKTIGFIATAISTVANVGLAGFSIISGAISVVTMTVTTLLGVLSGVAGIIGTVFSFLGTVVATVFGAIGTVIAVAFSPLGLAIIAIGAVAGACYLVYRNASAIGDAISNMFSGIVGAIQYAAASVYDFLSQFTEYRILFGAIELARDGIFSLGKALIWVSNSIAKPILSVIFSYFWQWTKIVAAVASTIGSVLLSCFSTILSSVSTVLLGLVSVIVSVFSGIVSIAVRVWSPILNVVSTVFRGMLSIAATVFRGFLNVIAPIGTAIKTVAGWVVSLARSFFVIEMPVRIISLLGNTIMGLVRIFSSVAQAIVSTFVSVVKNIPAIFAGIIRFIVALPSKIVGAVRGIVSGIGSLFSGMATFASNIFGSLVSVFSTVFNTIRNLISGFGDVFSGAFSGVGDAVAWLREQFGNLFSLVSETYGAIVAALSRGDIESVIGVVWSTIKLIWTQGTTAVVQTWHWLVETLQTTWAACVYKISELLTTAWYGVQNFWTETVYTMSTIWTVFADTIVGAWKYVEKTVAKGIGWIVAKMSGLDPNEMAANIDSDYNNQAQEREATQRNSLTDIQKKRDDKIAAIQSEKDGALDILQSDFAASAGTRDSAYQAKLAAQQKELDAAKAAYNEAINRAKNPPKAPAGEEPKTLAERLKGKVQAAIKSFSGSNALGSTVSASAGTFNALAMRGLGSSSYQNKILEKADRIIKNTDPSKQPKNDAKDSKLNEQKVVVEDPKNKAPSLAEKELINLNKDSKEHLRVIAEAARKSEGGLKYK